MSLIDEVTSAVRQSSDVLVVIDPRRIPHVARDLVASLPGAAYRRAYREVRCDGGVRVKLLSNRDPHRLRGYRVPLVCVGAGTPAETRHEAQRCVIPDGRLYCEG